MRYKDLLLESSPSPHAYKAIIVMGSPGSGKNTVIENLPFIDAFKHEDIDNVIHKLAYNHNADDRKKAWHLLNKRRSLWIKSSLPIVFNTTGRDFSRVEELTKLLTLEGYDIYGIMVFASKDVAMQRIQDRPKHTENPQDKDRPVDTDFASTVWDTLKLMAEQYANFFKNKLSGLSFVINDIWLDSGFVSMRKARKEVRMFLQRPVQNPVGQKKLQVFNNIEK